MDEIISYKMCAVKVRNAKLRNYLKVHTDLPWIPEPSTVNNKLKRREGSGSTGRFFD